MMEHGEESPFCVSICARDFQKPFSICSLHEHVLHARQQPGG